MGSVYFHIFDMALQILVENFVISEQYAAVNDIAKGITDKQYTLLEVVEALGSSLSSPEVQQRCRGTRLLAELLELLPKDWLSPKEVSVLISFFCVRLKDHHSITPHVVRGIKTLVCGADIGDAEIGDLVKAVFNEVHVQSLVQADRRHVYHLVDYILTNRRQAVEKMGTDFVFGYIQAMDGEKDPRNLILAFRCITSIAQNLPLGTFTEDLFEVFACYFPIDFTPPPKDPHGVRKEDLVLGVRGCMAAHEGFAEFGLPLLLEKLTSSIQSAKVDSFQTLVACCPVYKDKLAEYSGSLWSCVRREVFAVSSALLEESALAALTALVKVLSSDVTKSDKTPALDSFLQEVYGDLKRYLCEPEQKLLPPSGKILRAAAAASNPACQSVYNLVIPTLIEQYNQQKQVSCRRDLIAELQLFIKQAASHSDKGNPLTSHRDPLYTVLVELLSLSDNPLCHLGLQCIMGLLSLPSMLSPEHMDNIAQYLLQLVTRNDKDVREDAIVCLGQILSKMPASNVNQICDQMKNTASNESDPVRQHLALEVAARSCTCLEVSVIIMPHFLQLLEDTHQHRDDCLAHCRHVKTVVSQNVGMTGSVQYFCDSLLPRVTEFCLRGAVNDEDSAYSDWDVLCCLSDCVRMIICESETSKCGEMLADTVQLFLDGALDKYQSVSSKIKPNGDFKPLNTSSCPAVTRLVVLFSAVVCSVPRDLTIPRLDEVISALLGLVRDSPDELTAVTAAKCLAGIINKTPPGDFLTGQLAALSSVDSAGPDVASTDSAGTGSGFSRHRAVLLHIWLTKALVLRSHPQQKIWVDRLLALLSDQDVGQQAADGFSVILDEPHDVLRADTHANILFMYKQRFFVFTADVIKRGFHEAQPDRRVPHLTALSHLLKFVPSEAIAPHFEQLLPLLIQCLHEESASLWLSTLTTLNHVVAEAGALVAKHLDDIIGELLRLSQYKPKMAVRIEALRCLHRLTSLPNPALVPHQGHVTRRLLPVLDDHKRLVRREAVATREKWILIDAPGT